MKLSVVISSIVICCRSGINSEDMQIIYHYLIVSLLPSHLDLELQGGSVPQGNKPSTYHYGSFVTGPSNLKDSIVTTQKVCINFCFIVLNNFTVIKLTIFRLLKCTLLTATIPQKFFI